MSRGCRPLPESGPIDMHDLEDADLAELRDANPVRVGSGAPSQSGTHPIGHIRPTKHDLRGPISNVAAASATRESRRGRGGTRDRGCARPESVRTRHSSRERQHDRCCLASDGATTSSDRGQSLVRQRGRGRHGELRTRIQPGSPRRSKLGVRRDCDRRRRRPGHLSGRRDVPRDRRRNGLNVSRRSGWYRPNFGGRTGVRRGPALLDLGRGQERLGLRLQPTVRPNDRVAMEARLGWLSAVAVMPTVGRVTRLRRTPGMRVGELARVPSDAMSHW